ncbi:MAG: class I SAM-dependent methyltransferase [Anaerolineae bacterium]|nr:class I SAM-dependent methyltransferase [Anaerolineae bacterium]
MRSQEKDALGDTRLVRDHREKPPSEVEIERRWRQVLLRGGSMEDFQRAYDELHAEFLRRQGEDGEIYGEVNPRSERSERVQALILRYIGSGARVLEVGTGDGVTSYLLARQGNRVISVDVSRIALERAHARWGGDPSLALEFKLGDARALDFPDDSFDFVVSENMVEHISLADMHTHLQEVRRVLAPGGEYLLYTPSRLWSGRVSVGFHLHVYTLRELCRLLRSWGFQPVWLEPRLFHRLGRIVPVSGPGLWAAWAWEALLRGLQVQHWPVALKARIIPSVMVSAKLPAGQANEGRT